MTGLALDYLLDVGRYYGLSCIPSKFACCKPNPQYFVYDLIWRYGLYGGN